VENQAFSDGVQLWQANDVEAAEAKFEEALINAQGPLEEGRVAVDIAMTTGQINNGANYLAAIPLYKQIAANAQYPAITRAYAIQSMALLFYISGDPAVTQAIFKDAPYAAMYVPGSTNLSYRHLFDAAVQLYPLGLSEARVANWYSIQIARSYATTSPSAKLPAATVASYKDSARSSLAAADTDVLRIQNLPPESFYVPYIQEQEAITIGNMQLSGDSSFGNIDDAFKKAINSYAVAGIVPLQDGISRYYYAHFLLEIYGQSRITDIHALLEPLYTLSGYAGSPSELFFKTANSNGTGDKFFIIDLANADSGFKAYLEKLGWTISDFSAQ
jgi:hypothetical protein